MARKTIYIILGSPCKLCLSAFSILAQLFLIHFPTCHTDRWDSLQIPRYPDQDEAGRENLSMTGINMAFIMGILQSGTKVSESYQQSNSGSTPVLLVNQDDPNNLKRTYVWSSLCFLMWSCATNSAGSTSIILV